MHTASFDHRLAKRSPVRRRRAHARLATLALLAALCGHATAAPSGGDAPPEPLLTAKLAGPATLDVVMKLVGVERMAATFVEDKYSALLARPIVTEGTLVYDRARQELVSKAARLAYPVRDGVPVMLPEEARPLGEGE